MFIYLAGKVEKHGWREEIVGDSLNAPGSASDEYIFDKMLTDGIGDMVGSHNYCGPFLIACDHGCGHNSNNHGVVFQCWGEGENKKLVFETCKQGIESCDAIYCWIDEDFDSAYGTLWELGYAHALQKPIYVGIDKAVGLTGSVGLDGNAKLIDFWFSLLSVKSIGVFDSASDGFNSFFGTKTKIIANDCKRC